MINLPASRKGIFFGIGLALSLILLVSVFTVTEFFGFYTPETRAATCPWSDGDATDSDGGSNGTYTFTTTTHTVSPTSIISSRDAYDCTSATTGITTFIVPSGATLVFDTNTTTGAYADVKFTNLTVGGEIHSNSKGCSTSNNTVGYGPNPSDNICTATPTGYTTARKDPSNYYGAGGGYGDNGTFGSRGSISMAGGQPYGSPTEPILFGSSGACGNGGCTGKGGGVVRIEVTGTLTHNGLISSNGANGSAAGQVGSGGGAGGSIYISTDTIAGSTGTFAATGGNGAGTDGKGGGGSGGRLAIVYNTSSFSFASTDFDVHGGSHPDGAVAGKGSVYLNDNNGTPGTTTDDVVTIYHGFTYDDTDYSVSVWSTDASATNQYCASGTSSPSITAGTINFTGTGSIADPDLDCSSVLSDSDAFSLISNGGSITFDTFVYGSSTSGNQSKLDISGGPEVTLTGNSKLYTNVDWTTISDLTINSGSEIIADIKGCYQVDSSTRNGIGPDPADSGNCKVNPTGYNTARYASTEMDAGGGGYGGVGGNGQNSSALGGETYGSPTAPVYFGSSGANGYTARGGNGGGAVRIDVSGIFTHNGTISADGQNGATGGNNGGGGGSGGAIYITAGELAGSTGTFSAVGGTGYDAANGDAGGGGAGRVAIYFGTDNFSVSSTDFSMDGGDSNGANGFPGQKGTVFTKNTSTNAVKIFHGFTYDNTPLSATSWSTDASATNQYCASGTTAVSITANTMYFTGSGNTSDPDIDCGAILGHTGTFNLHSSGGTVTFDNFIYSNLTSGIRSYFNIDGTSSVVLTNNSKLYTNGEWSGLTNLTVNSGSEINANEKGCPKVNSQADGSGPDNVNGSTCGTGTGYLGYGLNTAYTGGGAGHGGAGGNNQENSNSGGASYPQYFIGASGGAGNLSSDYSGAGGGRLVIDISGALTVNGIISANGGDAPLGSASGTGGGGAGGSVYLTTGSIAGTGTLSATGGDVATGSSRYGGEGGGGLIYYGYISGNTFNDDGTCDVTKGFSLSSGTDGVDGICNPEALDDPPSIASVNINPSTSVSVSTPVSISVTATDDLGLSHIKIWVDENLDNDFEDEGELKVTCNYSTQTSATCSSPSQTYARTGGGAYKVKIEVKDSANQYATDDSTYSFTVSASTTSNQALLERLKAGEATIFNLSFELSGPSTGTLDVVFPSGFVLGDFGETAPSGSCSGGGTLDSFTRVSDTQFTAVKSNCEGTVSVSNVPITNPGTPGAYTITWSNDNGWSVVYIVDDDQVVINANVEPTMTFDLDIGTASTDENPGPYELDLGILSTTLAKGSDDSAVSGIWIDLSTNASQGAVITVQSSNAALKSVSTPADFISSAAVAGGAEGYGLCVSSSGAGVPGATAGSLQAETAFAGSCTTASWSVGVLTGAVQSLFNSASAPIYEGRAQVRVAASASSTTPAHADYADTLTFIATATY